MIEIRDLIRTYGEGERSLRALCGVSFSIGRGELVALTGPSGSGKSTLLKILGTLDTAFDGEVLIAGRSLRGMNDNERAAFRAQTIGFVFQSFHLLPHLSALENVLLATSFRDGVEPTADLAAAGALLDRVGLANRHNAFPNELSGGQQQRVAIARALHGAPDVLLCDEPTGNLDSASGERVLELLREVQRERGLTIVVVTHDDAVLRFADRTLTLTDGVLTHSEAPEEPADERGESDEVKRSPLEEHT